MPIGTSEAGGQIRARLSNCTRNDRACEGPHTMTFIFELAGPHNAGYFRHQQNYKSTAMAKGLEKAALVRREAAMGGGRRFILIRKEVPLLLFLATHQPTQ